MESNPKRIKLSLEPYIQSTAIDITETGHEIYKSEVSLPDQLMRNVDRIWFERGDWKDITEEDLIKSVAQTNESKATAHTTQSEEDMSMKDDTNLKENKGSTEEEEEEGEEEEDTQNVDVGKLRESVISKLYFAKCEIDVALDVINILAVENRPSTSNQSAITGTGLGNVLNNITSKTSSGLVESNTGVGGNSNLVLPPGTLHATYVSKPKLTEKAQLDQTQLTLGLKRTQQKGAADYLRNSAASLKKLVDKEQQFWEEAIRVRRNHWLMQSSTNIATNDSGFSIQYGFTDVGSDFGEISYGEMLRSDDKAINDKHVQLSLPHNIPKQVRVTIKEKNINHLNQSYNNSSEGILGIESQSNEQKEGDDYDNESFSLYFNKQQDIIQQQLIDAQSTVYDAELYSGILSEAQCILNNVQFEEDCITVSVDSQVDLIIRKILCSNNIDKIQQDNKNNQHQQLALKSSQQLIGRTIELAFRLLLSQRHKFNMWKSRARLMTSQRKTQHLLNSSSDSNSLSGSVAGTPGNTTLLNNPGSSVGPGTNVNNGSVGTGGGASTSGNTPVLSHRTVSNLASSSSSSSSSANISTSTNLSASLSNALSRQASSSHLNNSNASKELPTEVPILSPVLSMTKFWILFDRVRHVVHDIIDPLCGENGIGLAVHYKPQHKLNQSTSHLYCESYPSFGEMAISLGINIFKGSSLRFTLNQHGIISANVLDSAVTLLSVSEFKSYLLREITLICLHLVCDIANNIIQRTDSYKNAKGNERSAFIWQVDEVEETLHGSIRITKDDQGQPLEHCRWKTIHIQLNKTLINNNIPAYVLQSIDGRDITNNEVSVRQQNIKQLALFAQWHDSKIGGINASLGFKEKIAIVIKNLLN